jgi:hypothetical protein
MFYFSVGRIGAEKVKIGSSVIRCHEFDEIVAFWQEALRYVPQGTRAGRLGGPS